MRIGLTGGIGAGKSAVASRLAVLGAVVVDADQLAREAVAFGTSGLARVVAEFGKGVLDARGELDRSALATTVFADSQARDRLNAIVHPIVRALAAEREAAAGAGAVVVHDIPLLVETDQAGGFDLVIVVEAPMRERISRLALSRSMSEKQARERMATQSDDATRRRHADVVVINDGSLTDLDAEVTRVWKERIAPDPIRR